MNFRPLVAGLSDRWALLPSRVRAILFVSAGALLLTVMAVFVKILGERLHPAQLMFSRAMIGFLILRRGCCSATGWTLSALTGRVCI